MYAPKLLDLRAEVQESLATAERAVFERPADAAPGTHARTAWDEFWRGRVGALTDVLTWIERRQIR